MTIRTLVVDDEELARARLTRLLQNEADVTIVGECATGKDAIAAIASLRPDLLFLDVQMPEIDGFGVLRGLSPDEAPFVVFVTAFDEHAVRAFEVRAVDYLLKPIDGERVHEAVARVRSRVGQASAAQRYAQLRALIETDETPEPLRVEPSAERLLVRDRGTTRPIRVADVDWIDAIGNYARLHLTGRTHTVRTTLTSLEQTLTGSQFCRIHRSALVNLDRVVEVQPWGSGDSVVILRDGSRLRVSRRYRLELERRLGAAL